MDDSQSMRMLQNVLYKTDELFVKMVCFSTVRNILLISIIADRLNLPSSILFCFVFILFYVQFYCELVDRTRR